MEKIGLFGKTPLGNVFAQPLFHLVKMFLGTGGLPKGTAEVGFGNGSKNDANPVKRRRCGIGNEGVKPGPGRNRLDELNDQRFVGLGNRFGNGGAVPEKLEQPLRPVAGGQKLELPDRFTKPPEIADRLKTLNMRRNLASTEIIQKITADQFGFVPENAGRIDQWSLGMRTTNRHKLLSLYVV